MGKQTYLLCLMTIILVALTACGSDDGGDSETVEPSEKDKEVLNEDDDFPIVDDNIHLDIFARKAPATNDDWNDVMIWNKYEDMTNIDVTWDMVDAESLEEKRNLALGGGEMPDAFHGGEFDSQELQKYGGQGMLIPLNDLIDDYAPNFKELMEEYPEVEESVTMPDGNIYGLPLMSDPDFTSYRIGPKPFINKDWLDDLGMDMPETTEEFREYLTAVKEEDPGDNDGIPFGGEGVDQIYSYLLGSFGLQNKGSSGGLIDVDPETDDYRFFPTSEEYKELMEYMHGLYEDELLGKNIFSIEPDQYLANSADGKYGSVVWYSPTQTMGEETGGQYEGMPALEGPHGDKTWTTLTDTVLGPGAFTISKGNDYPATTLRWADYFYGDEGLKMYFMGIEGETYEENEDGDPEYMDHTLDSDEGLSYEEELAKYLTFPGGGYPSMTTEEYFKGAESSDESLDAADKLEEDLVEDRWNSPKQTQEEDEKLDGFGSDIEKYVEEMREKFISGDESLDDWDDYVDELKKMDLDDYIETKKAGIERGQED